MNTLQAFLAGRLIADPRAHIGALEIQHSRILLNFGAIGDLPRVVLGIEGNKVTVLSPQLPADDAAGDDDLAVKLAAAEAEIVTLKGTIDLLSKPAAEKTAVESPDGAGGTTAPADTGDGAGAPSGAQEQPAAIDPAAHTRDELVKLAADAGVTIAPKATKADIAAALNAPK